MISILDFEDSFTFNIASEFKLAAPGTNIEVINLENIKNFLDSAINTDERRVIVLGPGPGNPDQHRSLHPLIKTLLHKENIFIFGVCLGHQILGQIFGYEIKRCKSPIHGECREFLIKPEISRILKIDQNIKAQCYNSLAVVESEVSSRENNFRYKLEQNNEVFLFLGPRLLSYQFHPESIGTNYRSSFLRYPLSFLL